MWGLFRHARRRLGRDQRGNVSILFAFSAVPLVGLVSGAVDLARGSLYKATVLNAMDSAAIALVRSGIEDDAEADTFVGRYIEAMLPEAAGAALDLAGFDATRIEGGYRVTAQGSMNTELMSVVGIKSLPIDLETEVMSALGPVEIALALDNTGSMARFGRIEALRDSAGALVDQLYADPTAAEKVSMALVPFVTAVNIKTEGVFQPTWIEPTGAAATYGVNFSQSVDRLGLFDSMRVSWKGCVEAREHAHDEDDSPPQDAATRWVPYLWPDEPDNRGFGNDYLRDSASGGDWNRLRDVGKYTVRSGTRVADTISKGPNAACPRPIVELTRDTDRMHREIDKMVPHNTTGANNSGTNVAQGLAWAWRVLSPEEPFSQGAPYDDGETTKVLVLLSDGRNQVVANSEVTRSDYTSYGYLAAGRLGSTNDFRTAERAVDEKVRRICEAIKKKGIRLYTLLFQVDFEETQDLFRECASKNTDGDPLYYYIPEASDLEAAFQDIGKDLTGLYISR